MPDIFVSPPASGENLPVKKSRKTNMLDQALSAYLFMPAGVRFETQQADEEIILLLRKHWITNLTWMVITVMLIVMPLILFPLVMTDEIIPPGISDSIITFFIFTWYLLSFSYILVNFLLWYFTVSIVTNERIIDIDFVNILHKKFAATRIAKVEDITLKTGGFIRTIFDYGDVIVQTAGTEAQFGFFAVPHPEQVVRTINDLMEEEEEEGGGHV